MRLLRCVLLSFIALLISEISAYAVDTVVPIAENLTQIVGAAPSATNPLAVRATDGAAFYVAAKTGQFPSALGQTTSAGSISVVGASDWTSQTAPLFTRLTDGTTAYVGAKTGQFPTALGQTTKTGSLSVTLASDQGALPVTQGFPTGAANNVAATVNISSGATTTIVCKSALAVSSTFRLYRARVAGAALGRCLIQYNDNASITKFAQLMTSAAKPSDETSPGGFPTLVTSATATTQQIEAVCTNFDGAAQDFSCDVSYCIGASGC